MYASVPIALFAWPLVALCAFALMPARRAVMVTFIGAWMFLPMAGFKVPGFVDYTKVFAICLGTGLGIVVFDSGRVLSFRPSWMDLPIAVWCLAPMAASLSNGLGAYDGMSGVIVQVFSWGIPYLIGRLYFADLASLRELARAIVIGGVLYIPLCLFEIRFSPQLHDMLYGFHPAPFRFQKRFGGYRPMVFMDSGLANGLWMCLAALIGVWLWASRSVRSIFGQPIGLLVVPLVLTAVLCKSLGAAVLMTGGLGVLFASKFMRTGAFVLLLIIAPTLYIATRSTGLWSGSQVVDLAHMIDPLRAASLQFRFDNEDVLAEHALRQPLFGWGGWSRNRPLDEKGRNFSVTDGLWVIAMGKTGLVSLGALITMSALPVLRLMRKYPPRRWQEPALGAAGAMAMVVLLVALDNLLNAMLNPVFMLPIGGLTGLSIASALPTGARANAAARPPGPAARPAGVALERPAG